MPLFSLIAVLCNTLSLVVVGAIIFITTHHSKKKELNEETEKKKLTELYSKYQLKTPPFFFEIKKINVLLTADSAHQVESIENNQEGIKNHYLFLTLYLEVEEASDLEVIESLSPVITDNLINLCNKHTYHELVTAVGRYTLAAKVITLSNNIIASHAGKPNMITNTYFGEFVLQ